MKTPFKIIATASHTFKVVTPEIYNADFGTYKTIEEAKERKNELEILYINQLNK